MRVPQAGQWKTARAARPAHPPVTAAGKLFSREGRPFHLRGVTYGTFAPDANGDQFPPPERVESDFRAIAANGFNTVRLYTAPPVWVADLAAAYGLELLIGLTWEQHVAFLADRATPADIRRRVSEQLLACRDYPAVLGFTIGNEIPASIVRWHGRKRIQNFLHELYDLAKSIRPDALATYVNFPTTAYLELPFLDFSAFNVYLEDPAKFSANLKRLQNLACDQPLVLAELGLDSRRNGEEQQARSLARQIRTAFREGCAGAFVYAWTDEWHRGGEPILDWDFGITTRARVPKPALKAARTAMAEAPFSPAVASPKISIVVCSYNGAATIRDTLDGIASLDYSSFETIVVNDGSTDSTAEIAAQYDVKLINTVNQGLGQARNEGLAAATGEIVAYIDDDAYPQPLWLKYLADAFRRSPHACMGGPNLVPPEDGWIGQCVADSPGGPLHVLLTDDIAEHVPGCNMAFRRARLAEIGGFDPLFRAAGDDVDVCWRLQEKGWTVGFAPAAMVWHHRRATIRRYWRQQTGYGRAEALLERKWPERFSALGHMSWSGQIYGRGLPRTLFAPRPRIYQGTWGLAPYQGLYRPAPHHWVSLALTPEWLLFAGCLLAFGLFGFVAAPFGWAAAIGGAMMALFAMQAFKGAAESKYLARAQLARMARLRTFSLIAVLHMIQPAARLKGRICNGLTPLRQRKIRRASRRPITSLWSETWRPSEAWLHDLETELVHHKGIIRRGGDYEECDLHVRGGLFAGAALVMGVDDHARGKQYLRFRTSFEATNALWLTGAPLAIFAAVSFMSGAWPALFIATIVFVALGIVVRSEWSSAAARIEAALGEFERRIAATLAEQNVVEFPDAASEPSPAHKAEAAE